jgi:protein-S-isoprenylcysteine O-methyltransferase Ste14
VRYVGPVTMVTLVGLVLARVTLLRAHGIRAMRFGETDKTDFIIPPFALFYIYLVFAAAFGWPAPSGQRFFAAEPVAWAGALLCGAGVLLLLLSLVSFGTSFRVGIDPDQSNALVTTGVFAVTRNPIYVAFGLVLIGQFLLFPNWILLAYLVTGFWLLNRQVLREEAQLKQHFGAEYAEYSRRVRRYV